MYAAADIAPTRAEAATAKPLVCHFKAKIESKTRNLIKIWRKTFLSEGLEKLHPESEIVSLRERKNLFCFSKMRHDSEDKI